MSWLLRFARSTIGMKVVMATSGLLLFGFVTAHMIGNLQVFLGAEELNKYGTLLQGTKELLWGMRIGLLLVVIAHIVSAATLVMRSRASRPQGYKVHAWNAPSYAARTMKFGGVILLLFIVYHLLHLTVGAAHPDFTHCATIADEFTCNPYRNVVIGFSNPLVSGFYIIAQLALGMHLAHGAWSMLRTLGMNNPRQDALAKTFAKAFAVVIVVGNCSIPIAVLIGLVK